ncbi:MAG: exopolyphosphatase/guanosine-5'-triphosphate,3'-diphosphate pyrophosphatase [Cognaticolwellia sp.]|jgi:exopolyphosphatase/guanosine-5'-triphosphate,3'-diphosphate pyrophosphatase
MRVAVIDLGTNTFHLLIATTDEKGNFSTLYRIREYVYIGEDGVKILGKKPLERAYDTLKKFKKSIDEYEVEKVTAFGTAALRTASNGEAFVDKVRTEIGIEIEMISGAREADLIYLGTSQAIPMSDKNILIMDIGGGSVEFIIANKNEKIWAESFPVGVSVLFNIFHKSEPISATETTDLITFLNTKFQSLYAALEQNPAHILVGASGTFDIISGIMGSSVKDYPNCESADLSGFPAFYDEVVYADLESRLQMEKIPTQRAKLIPVALILIDIMLKKARINKMLVSAYAMKEGIIWEMARK